MPKQSHELRFEKLSVVVKRAKRRLLQLYAILSWIQEAHVRTYIDSTLKLQANVSFENNRLNQILDFLYFTHAGLYSKRCKSIDVKSAINIAARGTYDMLPEGLFRCKIVPTPADPDLDILHRQLDISIRTKIALTEDLPKEYDYAKILEGVLTLRQSNMFEIQLTLHNSDHTSAWIAYKFILLVKNHDDERIDAEIDHKTLDKDILQLLRRITDSKCQNPLQELYKICYYFASSACLRLLYVQGMDHIKNRWTSLNRQSITTGAIDTNNIADITFNENDESTIVSIKFWQNAFKSNTLGKTLKSDTTNKLLNADTNNNK
jgi:hypothetical protein